MPVDGGDQVGARREVPVDSAQAEPGAGAMSRIGACTPCSTNTAAAPASTPLRVACAYLLDVFKLDSADWIAADNSSVACGCSWTIERK